MKNFDTVIPVLAHRIRLATSETTPCTKKDVIIGIVIKKPKPENDPILEIAEGGVTGYESFFLVEKSIVRMAYEDWTACMGTPGVWDKLVVPWTSMRIIYDYCNLWSDISDLHCRKTERGFDIVEFEDGNGVKCSLQKSSAAQQDMIWLGCDDANPRVLVPGESWQPIPMPENYLADTRMHLTREQAMNLLPLLERFVRTGEVINNE